MFIEFNGALISDYQIQVIFKSKITWECEKPYLIKVELQDGYQDEEFATQIERDNRFDQLKLLLNVDGSIT